MTDFHSICFKTKIKMAQLTGSVFLIDSMQTRQADILDRNECSKSSWAFET